MQSAPSEKLSPECRVLLLVARYEQGRLLCGDFDWKVVALIARLHRSLANRVREAWCESLNVRCLQPYGVGPQPLFPPESFTAWGVTRLELPPAQLGQWLRERLLMRVLHNRQPTELEEITDAASTMTPSGQRILTPAITGSVWTLFALAAAGAGCGLLGIFDIRLFDLAYVAAKWMMADFGVLAVEGILVKVDCRSRHHQHDAIYRELAQVGDEDLQDRCFLCDMVEYGRYGPQNDRSERFIRLCILQLMQRTERELALPVTDCRKDKEDPV